MSDPPTPRQIQDIVSQTVFVDGANVPFGELTRAQVVARADELRSVSGWGPTVRVVPVAHAWRELALEMERTGTAQVRALAPERIAELAPRLWVTAPL